MALSTTTLELSDVVAHFLAKQVSGTPFTDFSDCVSAFDSTGANNDYYTSPCNSLKDFRGYDHPVATVFLCRTADATTPTSYEVNGIGDWEVIPSSEGSVISSTTNRSNGSYSIKYHHNSGETYVYASLEVDDFITGRTYRIFYDIFGDFVSDQAISKSTIIFKNNSSDVTIVSQELTPIPLSYYTDSYVRIPTTNNERFELKIQVSSTGVAGNGDIFIDNIRIKVDADITIKNNASSKYDEANSTTGWSRSDSADGTLNSVVGTGGGSSYYISTQLNSTPPTSYHIINDGIPMGPLDTISFKFNYRFIENISKAGKALELRLPDSSGNGGQLIASLPLTGTTWTSKTVNNITVSSLTTYRPKFIVTNPEYLDIIDVDNFEIILSDCAAGYTVPGAPTSLTATSIATTTFTLGWTAPSFDGNKSITDYKIYKGGSYYGHTGNTSTSKGITGQTAGSTATWTVKAVNTMGDGTASSGKSVTMAAASLTSFSFCPGQNGSTPAAACSAYFTGWLTFYHDGSGTDPVLGDYIYSDSGGSTPFAGNNQYYIVNIFGGSVPYRVADDGEITLIGSTCH